VDLRYDNQIIVNPDMDRAAKTTALTPSAAKTAAAAGVKPAALLTRVGPHDRPIPEPAFELSPQKIDPKKAVATKKKALVRTKRQKTVVTARTAAKAPTRTKKVASVGKEKSSVAPRKYPGGQKPSPAIARSQASQDPAD
jgi:hypothetical protein